MFFSYRSIVYLSAAFVTVAVLGLPTVASASQNLLLNSDFDSSIEGWTLATDSGFGLTWDSSMGYPSPGSLRLYGTYQGFGVGVAEALGECIETPPDTTFTLEAVIFANPMGGAVKCVPFITRYEGPSCTGERTRLGFPPPIEPTPTGVWVADTTQVVTSAALPSFRVSLFFWLLSGEEQASCNFDSVVLLEEGADVTDVPVDSTVGLALFILCLGLSASWLLRTAA